MQQGLATPHNLELTYNNKESKNTKISILLTTLVCIGYVNCVVYAVNGPDPVFVVGTFQSHNSIMYMFLRKKICGDSNEVEHICFSGVCHNASSPLIKDSWPNVLTKNGP